MAPKFDKNIFGAIEATTKKRMTVRNSSSFDMERGNKYVGKCSFTDRKNDLIYILRIKGELSIGRPLIKTAIQRQ